VWLLLLSGSLAADLSVDELADYALAHSPVVEAAQAQADASYGSATQAWSQYMPTLSARAQFNAFVPFETGQLDGLGTISARLDQLIYAFGSGTGSIRAAKQQRTATESDRQSRELDVVFQTKVSAYQALAARYQIDVSEAAVKAYTLQKDQAEAGYDVGVRDKIDVTNAGVNVLEAEYDLVANKADFRTAMASLTEVIGGTPSDGTLHIAWPETDVYGLRDTVSPPPEDLKALIAAANDRRPELVAGQAQIESTSGAVVAARSGWLPRLGANASVDYFSNSIWPIPSNFQAGVNLSWNVFPGMSAQGAIREAKGSRAIAEASLRASQLQIEQQVTEAYLEVDSRWQQIGVAMGLMELADENLALAKERYDAGLGDLVEYNDALTKQISAQSRVITSVFGYLAAQSALDRATAAPVEE